jgi:hypothetical protein
MHSGSSEADEHMRRAVERLREAGLDVEGKVGDPDPVAAVEDAVNFDTFDAAIVSTLPTHLSKWLKLDLPHRVAKAVEIPVVHLQAESGAEEG